jgi:hypothetical protein
MKRQIFDVKRGISSKEIGNVEEFHVLSTD